MKRITIICIALALGFTIQAQDKSLNLDDFHHLDVYTNIKMELIPSTSNKMDIDIIHGEYEDLRINQNRGKLTVYFETEDKGYKYRTEARIKLYYKTIDELGVSAGARVFSDAKLVSDDFDAAVSSGGSLDLEELQTGEIDVKVSSGGIFEVAGEATNLDINASSGGIYKGSKLQLRKADADASSGGIIYLWTTNSIAAKTSSGGIVKYKGDPKDKNIKRDKWSGGIISSMNN